MFLEFLSKEPSQDCLSENAPDTDIGKKVADVALSKIKFIYEVYTKKSREECESTEE